MVADGYSKDIDARCTDNPLVTLLTFKRMWYTVGQVDVTGNQTDQYKLHRELF